MGLYGYFAKKKMKRDYKKGLERAKIYGVDEEKYDKYYKEKQKSIFMKTERARRDMEEKKALERLNRRDNIKKAVASGLKKHRQKMKKNKPVFGMGGGGPQFGLSKSPGDIRIKKKLY